VTSQERCASPSQRHRTLRRPRDPRRFDGAFAAVLATESAAEIRHDHANALWRQVKRAAKLVAHAERILRRRPCGQLAIVAPLRHRGARLHRYVLNVRNVVRLLEFARRIRTFRRACVLAQMFEQLQARRMRRRFPLRSRSQLVERDLRREAAGRGNSDELIIAHRDDIAGTLRRIDRNQLRAVSRRTQHLPVQHVWPLDV
jgi:hypothetical protein